MSKDGMGGKLNDVLAEFGEVASKSKHYSDYSDAFMKSKQSLKQLFLDMMKESYGESLYGETTARDIYVHNLRKKVEEL